MGTSERYHQYYRISWDKIQEDCREIARRLLSEKKSWNKIIAVTRGGLIPAGLFAREMDIHEIDTVCISSYCIKDQGELTVIKNAEGISIDKDTIIIDDLCDTGTTAKVIKKMFPEIPFVTLYVKPLGKEYPDYFLEEVSQNTWVLFPWDTDKNCEFIPPLVNSKE